MKILIVYSKEGNMESYIESLCRGAESRGHQVTVKETLDRGELVSCHSYDLLMVGSPIFGSFGGKISEQIKPYLSSMKRTGGQKAIAFTKHKMIGTDKGLRKLMGVMESYGCIVNDFRAFRSSEEAYQYGAQL